MAKCREKLDPDLLLILSFPKKGKAEDIESFLKTGIKGRLKRLKTYSAYRLKKRSLLESEKVVVLMDEMLKLDEESFNDQQQKKYLTKVEKLDSPFWRDILSLYISLHSNNSYWQKRIVDRLIKIGPYPALIYGLQGDVYNNQLVVNFVLRTIDLLKNKSSDEHYKYLANRFASYGINKVSYKQLINRFNASWSLQSLRKQFGNPYLRFLYFDFWIERLMNRTSETESYDHVDKVMKRNIIKSCDTKQLWFLNNYYPADEKVRSLIVHKFDDSWASDNWIEKYQIIQMLHHQPFKQELSNSYKEFKRPNFKIERDFYLELLRSGHATYFAFYKLYQLGDQSLDYLWWLIF